MTFSCFCAPVVGILYTLLSIAFGIWHLAILSSYTEHDIIWPYFKSLHVAATLSSILNTHQFTTPNTSTLDITSISSNVPISKSVQTNPSYPRSIMYNDLTAISNAIQGLRYLQVSSLSFVTNQYCWADFDRRWELGHTLARQSRCYKVYKMNAAMYLEATIRNIDFIHWIEYEPLVGLYIAQPISMLSGGQIWLEALYAHKWVSVEEEALVWTSYNLTSFALQYGNRYQIGIQENVAVENAVGLKQSLTTSSIPVTFRSTQWMSTYLYGCLANDMYALSVYGANISLVRNTTYFFGDTHPLAIQNWLGGSPLAPLYSVVSTYIGPLGSIDLLWLSIPGELTQLTQNVRAILLSTMMSDTLFAKEFAALSSLVLQLTPAKWNNQSLSFYGGNPMCGYGFPLHFVHQTFGFDDTCSTQSPLEIELTSLNALFAKIVLGGEVGLPCSIVGIHQTDCLTYLQHLDAAYSLLPSSVLNTTILQITVASLRALNLSIMQYVGANSSISIETQPVLEGDMTFFGMTMVYDWAMNVREAISVQGDVQTINLLSYAYRSVQQTMSMELNSSWVHYIYISAMLFSIVMTAVGVLCLVLYVASGFPTDTRWFSFNRAVSSTWLNRTLILLRSVAAVACLSTAPLFPITNKLTGYVHFNNNARVWYESAILVIEATWSIYIAHDIIHPFFGEISNQAAPWSCGLASMILFGLDVWSPVQLVANLDRQCYSVNMDYMIYCSRGSIAIGSTARLVCIFVTMFLCVVVSVGCFFKMSTMQTVPCAPSLLLPLAFLTLARQQNRADQTEEKIDVVTAAMGGILRFQWQNVYYVFDSKLWLLLDTKEFGVSTKGNKISLPDCMHLPNKEMDPISPSKLNLPTLQVCSKKIVRSLLFISGLIYLVVTMMGNVTYLRTAQLYLANDYGWANFNNTGARVFLANLFNHQLLIKNHSDLNIATPAFGDISQTYNGTSTTIIWSETIARRRIYDPSVPLSEIIQGLREMDPCQLPWMFTQYCWLDLDRTYSMASTAARQQRCASEAPNGAVYLESALRNINSWDAWQHCWGDSFDIGIVHTVSLTTQGRVWLDSIQHNTNSIQQEVAQWQLHGITHFSLQWQNYKTLGLYDAMTVETALGNSYPLSLATMPGKIHLKQQTSLKMYWSLASDLWAISTNETYIGGRSLLQSSSNYAFRNVTSESLLYQNLTMVLPLTSGFSAVRDALGPFNSVDMKYIICPSILIDYYGNLTALLSTVILQNLAAQSELLSLPLRHFIIPYGSNASITTYIAGGNLLCGNDFTPYLILGGYATFFGVETLCHAYISDYIRTTPQLLLIAFAALISQNDSYNESIVCPLDIMATASCTTDYVLYRQFVVKYFSPNAQLVNNVLEAVQSLNIEIIHFLSADGNLPVYLNRQPLLVLEDPNWSYYSWLYMFQWANGLREIVSFQGDSGTITTISTSLEPFTMSPNPSDIPQTISFIFLGCVQYVTGVLIVMAILVAFMTLLHRNNCECINLFELNRVVGHVWIGRSLLFVRSITAIWLLNTTTLQLSQIGIATQFITPRLDWFTAVLAGAESTWFVYILNDLFSCITLQYTPLYTMKSSMLAWAATSIWCVIWPQKYRATLSRTCTYLNMDFELHCRSATVEIGSASGVLRTLLIGIIFTVVCYLFERWRQPALEYKVVRTTLLNASSYYMLELTPSIGSYLDKPTAMMAGILCFETQQNLHIFDTKSWRYICIPVSLTLSDMTNVHGIPLHQI